MTDNYVNSTKSCHNNKFVLLNSDHIPQLILTFTHKGYKYKLQTINSRIEKERANRYSY